MNIEPERIEVAISALESIGVATHADLHPDPSTMSKNEIHGVILAHVLNVAKMQMWLDDIEATPLDDCPERMFFLEDLLNFRTQQAASVIMALQLVN